jgi:hypothetical protein
MSAKWAARPRIDRHGERAGRPKDRSRETGGIDAGSKAIIDVGWERAKKAFLDYKTAVCREATAPAYERSLVAFPKPMALKALGHIGVAVLRDFAATRRRACTTTTNVQQRLARAADTSALDGASVTVISETSKGRSEWTLPLTPDLVEMLNDREALRQSHRGITVSDGGADVWKATASRSAEIGCQA